MEEFEIIQGNPDNLNLIKPLWEKLNELHYELSPYFKHRFKNMSWEKRKQKLIKKSKEILFEYAINKKTRWLSDIVSAALKRGKIKPVRLIQFILMKTLEIQD